MSIEKPVIGQPGWGLVLNAALDELDEKETIEGAEAKATQAYESAVEYTDTRINELRTTGSPVQSVVGKIGIVSTADVFDAIEPDVSTTISDFALAQSLAVLTTSPAGDITLEAFGA